MKMFCDPNHRKERRYALCNACAAVGRKKYDLYLTGWDISARGFCDRCKKEAFVAEYRLQEQGEQQPFSLGAYEVGKRKCPRQWQGAIQKGGNSDVKTVDLSAGAVKSETADVSIMLNQLELIFGDCSDGEIAKLERLERKLWEV